jgi:uncharacterized protein (DUF1778 family)
VTQGRKPAKTKTRSARLEARLPPHVHAMIKHAAALRGHSVTDFVLAAAQDAATRVITETEIMRLSLEDQRRFAEALLSPPKPTQALTRAVKRHRTSVQSD